MKSIKEIFNCKLCEGKDEASLMENILSNKNIPIEMRLFKFLMRTGDLLKEFVKKKEDIVGLTHAQINVLWILRISEERKLTQNDITFRLKSSKANISTLLDRMEKLELIERKSNPDNKKINEVNLTEVGSNKIEEMVPKILPQMKEIFKGFSEQEKEQFLLLLNKLRGNLLK
ncbi:hypothetical protein BVX95_00500 [archaeon D22]|nr:hypothetical protein BVX95_00500 [archaeon D22]